MNLTELTTNLQTLCHEGHSLDEVLIDIDGKNGDEIYLACIGLKFEPYITEIRNAEKAIENYAMYYHARENECPDSFKFLMMANGWHSPFIALNELLKVIYTNEMILKREGKKKGYRSRYREMEMLVQKHANER